MPPKKQKGQKMAIQDFLLTDQFGASSGSWADDVEDEINITSDSQLQAFRKPGNSSDRLMWGSGGDRGGREDRYGPRPIPDAPPYKAHVSGLPSDMMDDELKDAVSDAFNECQIEDISIITTKAETKFAFITFATRKDLEKVAGDAPMPIFLNDRKLSVQVADRREERRPRQEARDLDWSAKKSLPPVENRTDRRDNFKFGDRRGQQDFNGPRGPPSELGGDRGDSDFNRRGPRQEPAPARELDWGSKRGPLSPLPQTERPASRSGSQPRGGGVSMDSRSNSYRGGDRRASPAQWGEPRQEGSRPPRREFSREERPARAPTAAEMDSQWRRGMRPDNVQSPNRSRDGSEAPPSPAGATTPAARPAGRPVLNLAKRTVSDAADVVSPPPTASDSKSNPFGAARPIDTRARELEIETKREQARKEAEEKKKLEDERLAKEKEAAAAAEEAAKQAEAEAEAAKANGEAEEKAEEPPKEGAPGPKVAPAAGDERKGHARPRGDTREGSYQKPSRAVESGNWRQPSGEQRGPRGAPAGPRRGGGGPGRGNKSDNARPPKSNGGSASHAENQPSQQTSEPQTPTPEDDGWTTVPNKRRSVRPPPVAS